MEYAGRRRDGRLEDRPGKKPGVASSQGINLEVTTRAARKRKTDMSNYTACEHNDSEGRDFNRLEKKNTGDEPQEILQGKKSVEDEVLCDNYY